MAHTYASVAEFKAFLKKPVTDTANDETFFSILGGSARSIDAYCNRSRFKSGFGPRIGTNHYTGCGDRVLWLDDDLLSVSSLQVSLVTGGSATSYTENTDYYPVPFDRTAKRRLDAIDASTLAFGYAQRGIAVAGTFGYSNETVAMTATTAEALDASETAVDVSSGTAFSPGQTLLIDAEHLYVTAVATNTLTVVRGANGSTAATHNTASAIARYTYPNQVVLATMQLAQRRWKARDAGLDGTFGGGGIPVTGFRETERSLLRAQLWDLRCVRTADGHLAEVDGMAA